MPRARKPLTRVVVLKAALRILDEEGLEALSMRRVAAKLGVEAMSLYHHVAGKDDLIGALSEWVYVHVEVPGDEAGWREAMTVRAASLRDLLVRHPWALSLMDSRPDPGPIVLAHHDAVIGTLRRGGFPIALAARAYSAIDAYVFGFALTERNLPFDSTDGVNDFAEDVAVPVDAYPYLAELVGELTAGGDYSFAAEFDLGLEIILDGLERRLLASP